MVSSHPLPLPNQPGLNSPSLAVVDPVYVAVRPVDAFIRVRPPLLLHTDACRRAPPPPVYTVCELCRCRFLVRHTSPLGA